MSITGIMWNPANSGEKLNTRGCAREIEKSLVAGFGSMPLRLTESNLGMLAGMAAYFSSLHPHPENEQNPFDEIMEAIRKNKEIIVESW